MPVSRLSFAGVASAQPILAAPIGRLGRAYTADDPGCNSPAASRLFWTSRWHVHIHSATEQTYRHVATGLTFATDPADAERFHLVRELPGFDLPASVSDLAYAAIHCRPPASLHYGLRMLDGRDGAFLFYFAATEEVRFITEDAAPLPRIA